MAIRSEGRIIELDPNSSKWWEIKPVEVVAENDAVRDLVTITGGLLGDSITGLKIGVWNAATGSINSITQPFGPIGAVLGAPNPFEIDSVEPSNARQAAYAIIAEAYFHVIVSTIAGSSLSVVSETTATRFKPFFCKSVNEIDNMFKVKGFQLKGPDPISGRGNYVSPSGRGFHLDANHPPGKLPHVGVHRPREYRGPLVTRDFFIRR